MTILLDCDGVVNNFQEELLVWLNTERNTSYTIEDITHYDWIPDTFGEDCWWPTTTRAFWDDIKIDPEAVKFIANRIIKGDSIYLTSASYFTINLHYKIQKMLEYLPLTQDHVILTQNKSIVNGDVLIDDCCTHLNSFPKWRICFEQPWNEEWQGAFRSNEWDKIDKWLDIIKVESEE